MHTTIHHPVTRRATWAPTPRQSTFVDWRPSGSARPPFIAAVPA
jgi:hypothetical protein